MKRYVRSDTDSKNDNEWRIYGDELDRYQGSSENVVVPDGIKEINPNAFMGCDSLVTVVIPEGVKYIYREAFYACDNLKNVTLPNTLKLIGSSAFFRCENIEQIVIPGSVIEIRKRAFASCTNLKTVKFADGSKLESIGEEAFANCRSLKYINLPSSVESIGSYAFYGCENLTNIKLPNISISKTVFENSGISSNEIKNYKTELMDDESQRNSDQSIDDWYMSSDGEIDNDKFAETLESLVKNEFDVSDYFEEPSIQGFAGADYINIELGDGSRYSFVFGWSDMQDNIYINGPEVAAKHYFNEIKEGIESGSALVQDIPTL